ncbi:unnamed protein product [Dibothriocephalus latus]|uniref:Fibronectin type-III domain-containing protein n=1 Tax=Dibothriocephalus latus TaxID=60516 RepID=A0A3P7M1Z3_DIBLA|nr:unnamed protein product [Dibothriocephalus latus]
METLSDVQVKDITGTSFSLSWTQPAVDRSSSFEYKVTLKSTNNLDIAERSFFCETTTLETGEVSCQVDDVYTDVGYSVSLTACATANLCAAPSEPIIIKPAMKDGYTLHPPTIESRFITVSWSSSQAKPGNEFRVLVNSSVVETCAPEVTVGEHSCQISGLLPTQKYNVKIVECQKGTHVCGDLCSFLVQTTTDGRLHSMLTDLAKDIDHPTTAPSDPSSQLMIRVAYSTLGVPAVGNLKAVSAVITPVAMGNPPEGPNWSSVSSNPAESSKVLQMVGGVSEGQSFVLQLRGEMF